MVKKIFLFAVLFFSPKVIFAGEQNLKIPTLSGSQSQILIWGLLVCVLGMGFGFYQFLKVKKIRAHKSMLDVAGIIL
jgi:K(+)-stimulated pyrophosphate-energized sodium pump